MSGENVVEFLGSEEVFESYGTEVRLKEIIENGKSDIETVAMMGQFLLKKFMDQNEEINSLQSNLSERNQEMEHLKERHKYLKVIEETYQEAANEKVLELENLKRSNHGHQQKLRRLQREVVRSNETETSLRKSIFELAKSQSCGTFQSETFRYLPNRNYCLLCLNPNDQSNDRMEETGDQLQRAQNNCARLEQDVQNEKRQKQILEEKLLALRKEADALTQYLQWLTKVNKSLKSDDPGEMSEKPLGVDDDCDDAVEGSTHKLQECQAVEGNEDIKQDKDVEMSEVSVQKLGDDECNNVVRIIEHSSQQETGKGQLKVEEKMEPEMENGNNDNTNTHRSLSIVDGMFRQCRTALDRSPGRIQQLFTTIISFLRSLMKK